MAREHPDRIPEGESHRLLEAIKPPDSSPDCALNGPHWHEENEEVYFHHGQLWGTRAGGSWIWLDREKAGWRAWGGPDESPALWRDGRWWVRKDEAWFWLKDGAPAGYEAYEGLRQAGFAPDGGGRILYSSDGRRLALMRPGEEPVVADCVTRQILFSAPTDRAAR